MRVNYNLDFQAMQMHHSLSASNRSMAAGLECVYLSPSLSPGHQDTYLQVSQELQASPLPQVRLEAQGQQDPQASQVHHLLAFLPSGLTFTPPLSCVTPQSYL